MGVESNLAALLGGFVGFILTLSILSYAFGDNAIFRSSLYLFIGASTGFVLAAVFFTVIWPMLLRPILFGVPAERLLTLVPLFLSLLLLTKALPRYSSIGSPVMAFLVGVGAAAVIGGAVLGTLFPQIQATVNLFDTQTIALSGANWGVILFNNLIILFGFILTLVSFQFGTRAFKNENLNAFWKVAYSSGRIFVALTFGVIYAGVIMASLSALVERFNFMVDFIFSLFKPG